MRRSVAAFGAGGEFSPDEVDGEGEDGEDEQKVDWSVRDMAEEDCDEPEDGQHGGEQKEKYSSIASQRNFAVLALEAKIAAARLRQFRRRLYKDAAGGQLVVQRLQKRAKASGRDPSPRSG